MSFNTDQQTLDDLNIFGRRGGDSVYGLFNRTHTRNGAALLEDIFRHPMSDVAAINQRSGLFRYFATAVPVFPFQNELFDIAEQYLSVTDDRTRLSAEKISLGDRISSLITEGSDYKALYKGVVSVVEILRSLATFLKGLPVKEEFPYRQEKDALEVILYDPELRPLLEEELKGKWPQGRVAAYDGLLRFRHRHQVRKILQYIYWLDVYIAVGKVGRERGFVTPVALTGDGLQVRLEGLFHPTVKNAVSNHLTITGENHVFFLTGANMAGKSTFMKTLGISLFLAHMGFPVPAVRMEFSVLDGIFTTINLPDDLGMGASHFYAEVLRVKKVAKELSLGKRLFVLFDELFRGTNVKDAYEATVALTAAFAERTDSIFLISTHIIEAAADLSALSGHIRFIYLPTRMEGVRPVYTYKLEEGVTADRHGMVIIENEGILDILEQGKK